MAAHNALFLKVIVLGDPNVGKTSLLNRYVHNIFSPIYKATIGSDFLSKHVFVNDRSITMQIWDTAGMERFNSLVGSFYRGADACVLVYDVTNPDSFRNLNTWREKFLTETNSDVLPMVVIGNKVDLDTRQISTKQAQQWCDMRNHLPYFETSAKDDFNVGAAFQAVAANAEEAPIVTDEFKLDRNGVSGIRGKCHC